MLHLKFALTRGIHQHPAKTLLQTWVGRPFRSPAKRHLELDTSTFSCGGGLDRKTRVQIQEFWREIFWLHINVKELIAAISAIRSLGQPKDTVSLTVDNQISDYYLQKGESTQPNLNTISRPLLCWCMKTTSLYKSTEVLPGKWKRCHKQGVLRPSRLQLKPHHLQKNHINFQAIQEIPLQTCLLPRQITNYHNLWLVGHTFGCGLSCHLEQFSKIYTNPPWSVIRQWLVRLGGGNTKGFVILGPADSWATKGIPPLGTPPKLGQFAKIFRRRDRPDWTRLDPKTVKTCFLGPTPVSKFYWH